MNRKCIALIKRDLILSRKRLLLEGSVLILFMLLMVLIRLSMVFGNLKTYYDDVDTITFYLWVFGGGFFMFSLVGTLNYNILISDQAVKWDKFAFTLPYTDRQRVLYRAEENIITYLIALLMSCLNTALACAVSGRSFDIVLLGGLAGIGLLISLTGQLYHLYLLLTHNISASTALFMVTAMLFGGAYMLYVWIKMKSFYRSLGIELYGDIPADVMDPHQVAQKIFEIIIGEPARAVASCWWAVLLIFVLVFCVIFRLEIAVLGRRSE